MKVAIAQPNEKERLEALYSYQILDSQREKLYDQITYLAMHICDTPVSLISLIDKDRQWFKSAQGLSEKELPRDTSFCSHAILDDELFEVTNAFEDQRFFDNPLVLDEHQIRYYAGMPVINPDGYRLGTLCVIDKKEKALNEHQKESLKRLAAIVSTLFELRKA